MFYIVTTPRGDCHLLVEQVNPRVYYPLYGLVSVYAVVQRVTTGPLEVNRVCLALQAQQPVTPAVLQLGYLGLLEEHPEEFRQDPRAFRGLTDVELGATIPVEVVTRAHVFPFSGVTRLHGTAVRGHGLPLDEHAYDRSGVDDVGLFPCMLIGYGVVMLVAGKVNVVVLAHGKPRVVLHLECLPGEFLEQGLLLRQELLLPAILLALHPGLVVFPRFLGEGGVHLLEGEEGQVAQLGVNPPVNDLHLVLHGGLVPRLPRAGGDDREAVMIGEVLHDPVYLGLVAVGLDYRCLQVVGNHDLGGSSQVLQAAAEGVQEIIAALAGDGHHENVIGIGHAGHEHLGLHHLPRFPVNVRERVPGEIHEELFTRVMLQDAPRLARFKQLPQVKAELGVTVPAGVLLPVLLPQEVTCNVGPAEFFFKVRDLAFEGLETLFLVGRVPGEKLALQHRVIQGQQLLDIVPVVLDLVHVIVHRPLVQPQFTGYPTVGNPLRVHAQHLLYFTHVNYRSCHMIT